MGLHPDGDRVAVPRVGDHPANVVDPAWASIDWTLARAMHTARFWWIVLAYVSALFAWYAVQVHQTKYLIEIGFEPARAAYALGLVGFMGIAGQIVHGRGPRAVGRGSALRPDGKLRARVLDRHRLQRGVGRRDLARLARAGANGGRAHPAGGRRQRLSASTTSPAKITTAPAILRGEARSRSTSAPASAVTTMLTSRPATT